MQAKPEELERDRPLCYAPFSYSGYFFTKNQEESPWTTKKQPLAS